MHTATAAARVTVLYVLMLSCGTQQAFGQTPTLSDDLDTFVTTWQTTEPDASILFPEAPDTEYDFAIRWGDGTVEERLLGQASSGEAENADDFRAAPADRWVEAQDEAQGGEAEVSNAHFTSEEGEYTAQLSKKIDQWDSIQWENIKRDLRLNGDTRNQIKFWSMRDDYKSLYDSTEHKYGGVTSGISNTSVYLNDSINIETDPKFYFLLAKGSPTFGGSVQLVEYPSGDVIWGYIGHSDLVGSVDLDSYGDVYSASADGEVHKIDGITGDKIWPYGGHNGELHWISADCNNNVYGADLNGELHKIDSESGDSVWVYGGHSNWVYGVDADCEGYVYTASRDGSVHKIDASTGDKLWSYTEHGQPVYSVSVGPGGYVYAGSTSLGDSDGEVHKIDSETGLQVWSYTGQEGSIYGISSDNYNYIYAASSENKVHKIGVESLFLCKAGGPIEKATVFC
jgi:hypothetical protein